MDTFIENGFKIDYHNKFTKSEIRDFQNFWNNLPIDKYILGDIKYRHRRYSKLSYNFQNKELEFSSSSYFQESQHNSLYGGEFRDFEPVLPSFLENPIFLKCLNKDFLFFLSHELIKYKTYEIGIHQIRTVSCSSIESEVTPEGIHKDGHFVFAIHFIDRKNVSGGITKLYNNKKEMISSITLDTFGQTMLIEDNKLYHQVTPIKSLCENTVGYRDVLIIEFY
jgi:hypothetical protein